MSEFGPNDFFRKHTNEAVFCLQAKKPLPSGSYERRVPKIKFKSFFCTRDVCLIQHRSWPLGSTILNPHGTNASPDGLCTRIHTNEAFSCWFCCDSFRVNQARRGNVCLEYQGKACSLTDQPVRKFKDGLGINMTQKTFFSFRVIFSCPYSSTSI